MRRAELRILTSSWKRNYGYFDLFEVVESARVLQNLTLTQQLFADLWEVRLRPGKTAQDLIGRFGIDTVSPVAPRGARELVVVRAPFHGFLKRLYFEYEVSFVAPIDFLPEAIRITLVGSDSAMRRSLSYLRRSRIEFETISAGRYVGQSNELLGSLTVHQQRVLEMAFEQGYFDVPSRVRTRDLAKLLGTSHQAVVDTLHRAERRLIASAIRQGRWSQGERSAR